MTGKPQDKPRIEKLQRTHEVDDFSCGQDSLDRYLQRYALISQRSDGAQTYVGVAGKNIIGYYTLTVGHVDYEEAAPRLTKGLSKTPIPIMLLARLAVDSEWQGKGVGSGLLRNAMQRTLQAADIAGVRAFLVHAKDDKAKQFYEYFDFLPSPTDPYHLFLFMKDIRKLVDG